MPLNDVQSERAGAPINVNDNPSAPRRTKKRKLGKLAWWRKTHNEWRAASAAGETHASIAKRYKTGEAAVAKACSEVDMCPVERRRLRNEAWIKAAAAGEFFGGISKRYSVARETVRKVCLRAGTRSAYRKTKAAEARRRCDQAVLAVAAGASILGASRRFHVHKCRLRLACQQANVQRRAIVNPEARGLRSNAVRAVAGGASLPEAARQFGLHKASVARACRAAGVRSSGYSVPPRRKKKLHVPETKPATQAEGNI